MMDWVRRQVAEIRNRRRLAMRQAFLEVFGTPGAMTPAQEAVAAELRRFCYATVSTFQADARAHALCEGRREVWLRIQGFQNLSEEQIISLTEIEDDRDD